MSRPRLRPQIALTITKKDLIDTLRDRRTVLMMVLVPMVTYPLMIVALSEATLIEQEAQKNSLPSVRPLVPLPGAIAEHLAGDVGLHFVPEPVSEAQPATSTQARELARAAIQGGTDVVVGCSTSAAAKLAGLGTAETTLYFDETARHGQAFATKVERSLRSLSIQLREDRLEALQIPLSAVRPLTTKKQSVATKSEVGGFVAGTYLPTVILMFITISCLYPAIDMIAGEKERGTLATLLTAPILAGEIVLGKYLAILTVGAMAGLLNVGVMTLTITQTFASVGDKASVLPRLHAGTVLGLLLGVLIVASIVASMMLAAATFARSFRDANNLLTPVLLAIVMPATLAGLPSATLTPGWAAVPIAGVVLWMKGLLAGKWSWELTAVVIASSLASAAVVLAFATRVFSDERARFSSEGSRADFRSVLFSAPEIGAGTALAYAAFMFVVDYYASLALSALPLPVAQPLLQIGLNLGSALLLGRWLSARAPGLAKLGKPSAKGVLAGIMVGVAAWIAIGLPAGWLTHALVPGMDKFNQALTDLFNIQDFPLWSVVLALSVFPAIGEEFVFRGAILRILSQVMKPRSAILLQALLFGIFHTSVFRLLPTTLLGVVLGGLALRTRSLVPSIVAHALNNGIVLYLAYAQPATLEGLSHPSPWPLAGLALMALAWLLLPRAQRDS